MILKCSMGFHGFSSPVSTRKISLLVAILLLADPHLLHHNNHNHINAGSPVSLSSSSSSSFIVAVEALSQHFTTQSYLKITTPIIEHSVIGGETLLLRGGGNMNKNHNSDKRRRRRKDGRVIAKISWQSPIASSLPNKVPVDKTKTANSVGDKQGINQERRSLEGQVFVGAPGMYVLDNEFTTITATATATATANPAIIQTTTTTPPPPPLRRASHSPSFVKSIQSFSHANDHPSHDTLKHGQQSFDHATDKEDVNVNFLSTLMTFQHKHVNATLVGYMDQEGQAHAYPGMELPLTTSTIINHQKELASTKPESMKSVMATYNTVVVACYVLSSMCLAIVIWMLCHATGTPTTSSTRKRFVVQNTISGLLMNYTTTKKDDNKSQTNRHNENSDTSEFQSACRERGIRNQEEKMAFQLCNPSKRVLDVFPECSSYMICSIGEDSLSSFSPALYDDIEDNYDDDDDDNSDNGDHLMDGSDNDDEGGKDGQHHEEKITFQWRRPRPSLEQRLYSTFLYDLPFGDGDDDDEGNLCCPRDSVTSAIATTPMYDSFTNHSISEHSDCV